jgi:tetraacyldisaccharide 4'-kinase
MTKPAGPVHPLLGRLIEPLYAAGIASRNRRFDRREAGGGVARLPVPVISVGNLSVGGTGKTPMVGLLVQELRAAGHTPCIAMRGYRPRRAGQSEPSAISDEAELYKSLFPDLPIVAQPDRTAGLRQLLATTQGRAIDCIILDDGFQHRQLARDLDIVLIDASRSPFDDHLLPRGWLREPTASLKRAHAVVITHAELADPASLARLTDQVARAHGRPPTAVTRHTWSALSVFSPADSADAKRPVSWLRDKRIYAVCAIGNPGGFFASAKEAIGPGGTMLTRQLRDHDNYAPSTVEEIQRAGSAADVIVTTAKDWTKLSRFPASTWPCLIARPHLELTFDYGRNDLIALASAAASTPASARTRDVPPGS